MSDHTATIIDGYSITRPLLGASRFCDCDECVSYAASRRTRSPLCHGTEARDRVAGAYRRAAEDVVRDSHVRPCLCSLHRDDVDKVSGEVTPPGG